METLHSDPAARGEGGVFQSLEDFLRRVPVERDEIESLIKCGAFDEVNDEVCRMTRRNCCGGGIFCKRPAKARSRALLDCAQDKGSCCRKKRKIIIAEASATDCHWRTLAEMQTQEYTLEQKLALRREILEVCVSGHPLDFLPRNGEAWSDELPGLRGKRVTLCGWVVTYRHVGTKITAT